MLECWRKRLVSIAALLGLSVVVAAGCAQDVGDIDRTQPDKIEKSMFEDSGEWYFQQTVVDTTAEGQSGAEITRRGFQRTQRPIFTAQVSRKLKRIKWEIHENVLYARSSVEPVEGLTEQIDGEDHQELGIVAAFPIKMHFDVQRQYNSSTGEPTNVIVENRSDRPWYDREYMRVDWSTNLVTSATAVEAGLGLMSPKAAAMNSRATPQEEKRAEPDRTRVTEDYVDAVTEYVFNPDLYACQNHLGYDSMWRCEGGTASVRNFFWRVDARKEQRAGHTGKLYEPMNYLDAEVVTKEDGTPHRQGSAFEQASLVDAECTEAVQQNARENLARMPEENCNDVRFGMFNRFGYFRTNFLKWSDERETYDSGRRQFAQRWNIWKSMYDENGEWLDYEDRDPEPIVYYLNAGYPKEMIPTAKRVEAQWDETFKEAVKLAKGYESVDQVEDELEELGHSQGRMFKVKRNGCHPSKIVGWADDYAGARGADRDNVGEIIDKHVGTVSDVEQELWNMPVEDRRRMCAELEWATAERDGEDARFTWQRIGDMRYSFFAWITDFNIGWLGYGPSSADPRTGEIISAAANFAGRLLLPQAHYAADLVQYLNGELSREEIINGDHVRREFAREDGDTNGQQQGLTPPESDDVSVPDVEEPSFDPDIQAGSQPIDTVTDGDGKRAADFGVSPERIRQEADRAMEASVEADQYGTGSLSFFERPNVKERLMSNPKMKTAVEAMAFEAQGTEGVEDESALHQGYVNLSAPMLMERQTENRQRLLQKNNIFSTDAATQMVEGLALYTGIAERFKGESREDLVEYMRNQIFYGTQLHEVGHTMGLRHNFSASLDPLNYHDAFWEIERRKQVGCQDGDDFEECVQDGKLTEEEARSGGAGLEEAIKGKSEFGYISQAEFRSASVMDYTADAAGRFAGLGKYDQGAINFAYAKQVRKWKDDIDFNVRHRLNLQRAHYSKIPSVFEDENITHPNSACERGGQVDEACVNNGIDTILNGRTWVSIEEAKEQELERLENNADAIAEGGDIEIDHQVDFNFCSDDRRGRTLGCETFDWGSNQAEVLSYAFEKFKTLQPLHRYRGSSINARGSVLRGYARRLLRTLSLADSPFRYFSFYNQLDYSVGQFTDDLEQASRMGMNFYGHLLTMPEPKDYCKYQKGDLPIEDDILGQARNLEGAYVPADVYLRARELGNCDDKMTVPEGPGQFFGYDLTGEYNYRLDRVGTYIDKTLAAGRLFQLDANFTFSSFITDQRAVNISYWTQFPDALYDFLHGQFLGDYENFGGGCAQMDGRNCDPDSYHTWQMVPVDEDGDGQMPQSSMPDNLRRVYDPSSFDIRMRIITNAMAEFSTWEDKQIDFSDYLIVAKDETELPIVPDESDQFDEEDMVSFVHPDTNGKFVALRAPDGKSITYDLIKWANELKETYVDAKESNSDEDVIEARREALENVVAKLNLIREARTTLYRNAVESDDGRRGM